MKISLQIPKNIEIKEHLFNSPTKLNFMYLIHVSNHYVSPKVI